jgi:NADH:ubiquinone reductase (H+-translocating)
MPERPRILLIGAGFAGAFCAKKLDTVLGSTADITLVSSTKHFEYHAQLYKVLNEGSPLQACIPLDVIFKNTNIKVVEDTISTIDKDKKIAFGQENSKYPYDYVVIALGSENAYFGIPGVSKYSYSMRSIKDALALSRHIHETVQEIADSGNKNQMEIVVVGGGPSGIEIAGELAEHSQLVAISHDVHPDLIKISLVEAMDHILPMLPPEQSLAVTNRLKELGVTVKTKTAIKEEIATGLLTEGETITTKTAIWVAGVKANHLYAEWGLQCAKNGRVEVNEFLQVPAHKDIFIAGDGAMVEGSGQAWPAIAQGELVAQNVSNILHQQPLISYQPPEQYMILPVGYDWAIAQIHGKFYTGSAGHLIHELYTLKFFNKLLPFAEAWTTFKTGGEMCHACHVCYHNHNQLLEANKDN